MNRADGMVRLREGRAHLPWDYELRVDWASFSNQFEAAMYALTYDEPVEVKAEGCDWATLRLDDFITAWAKLGLGTEDHDWDCDDADAAIQQALFGDLVFG